MSSRPTVVQSYRQLHGLVFWFTMGISASALPVVFPWAPVTPLSLHVRVTPTLRWR